MAFPSPLPTKLGPPIMQSTPYASAISSEPKPSSALSSQRQYWQKPNGSPSRLAM